MHFTCKGTITLTLALFLAGYGTPAGAGGKSPAPAYDVTLENSSHDFYGLRLTYPKIAIKGANLPRAEIEKMMAGDISLSDRLAMAKNFTAASVEISSVTGAFDDGVMTGEGSCSGLKLENIAGGKIGRLTLGGCSGQSADKSDGSLKFALGPSNLIDFNFLHGYRLWADKAGADDKEAVPLYGSSTIRGFSLSLVGSAMELQMSCDRRMESVGPKIKLLSQPIGNVIRQISELRVQAPVTSASRLAALTAIEFVENYEPAASIIENYSFSSVEGKEEPGIPEKFGIQFARVETQGRNQQASGISFSAGNVAGKIASVSWKDYSGAPFLAELKKLVTRLEMQADIKDDKLRMFDSQLDRFAEITQLAIAPYADLGTISARDLDMTISDAKAPATDEMATQDAKVSFKTFTLRLGKPFNGLPTAGRVAVENLRIPAAMVMPNGADNVSALLGLKQLGLDQLDLSYATDLVWNREAATLDVNEYSFALTDFFGFSAKGILGNASSDLFSWNDEARAKAIAGLTAKEISLHVEDKGGIDKMVKVAAANRGVTPDELKAFFPIMVALIPQPYVGMQSVQTVRDAVLAFWQKPGKLDISAKAKADGGFGLNDLIAARQDPKTVDDKIEVTAAATN